MVHKSIKANTNIKIINTRKKTQKANSENPNIKHLKKQNITFLA